MHTYIAMQCNTIQHCTVQYNTIYITLHYITLHYTLHYIFMIYAEGHQWSQVRTGGSHRSYRRLLLWHISNAVASAGRPTSRRESLCVRQSLNHWEEQ